MSPSHVVSDTLSDLPPILFYGLSIAALAPDPVNTKQTLFSGGGVSWMDGWVTAICLCRQGLRVSLAPHWGCLRGNGFVFFLLDAVISGPVLLGINIHE